MALYLLIFQNDREIQKLIKAYRDAGYEFRMLLVKVESTRISRRRRLFETSSVQCLPNSLSSGNKLTTFIDKVFVLISF